MRIEDATRYPRGVSWAPPMREPLSLPLLERLENAFRRILPDEPPRSTPHRELARAALEELAELDLETFNLAGNRQRDTKATPLAELFAEMLASYCAHALLDGRPAAKPRNPDDKEMD
jgi:hypothetical protein